MVHKVLMLLSIHHESEHNGETLLYLKSLNEEKEETTIENSTGIEDSNTIQCTCTQRLNSLEFDENSSGS